MALIHYDHEGCARFVTFCTHRKIAVLQAPQFRTIVVDAISEIHAQSLFRLYGYVIMPDHIHLVLLPPEKIALSAVVGEIKSLSAKRIHAVLSADDIRHFTVIRNRLERFALWQRRCYDHNCRSEEALWEKVNYCHNNPVRRGLVETPGEWKWSSYDWYQDCSDALLEIDSLP